MKIQLFPNTELPKQVPNEPSSRNVFIQLKDKQSDNDYMIGTGYYNYELNKWVNDNDLCFSIYEGGKLLDFAWFYPREIDFKRF